MKRKKNKINFLIFLILIFFSSLIYSESAKEVIMMTNGKNLENDSSWFIPLNASNNSVALFSEQREGFTIINKSKNPLVIKSISINTAKDVVDEEFSLQKYDIKHLPLDFIETTVEPEKRFEFYLRFYPVRSGIHDATLVIEFSDNSKFTINIKGSGGSAALFFDKMNTKIHKVFGGAKTDEMVTGMVSDDEGNVYFSGNVIGVNDKFAYDIFYGKIDFNGELKWAKLWAGSFRDASKDSGQNDETGGTSGAIKIDSDGFLYITGAISNSKSNNNFAALTLKIDSKTGDTVWEKMWRPLWTTSFLDKHSAESYALEVINNNVYVTGTTGGGTNTSNDLCFILCLSKGEGAIVFQKTFDPTPKSTDRAYAVKSDENGNIYIGGLSANKAFLIKIINGNTDKPEISWANNIDLGWGSNINGLDLDKDGNVYVSCDRRGAQTFFSVLKIDPSGKLVWGKTYSGGSNKNNNCNFVKIIGENVYAGGRTGQSLYDAQMGDALILKLKTLDGSLENSLFYFSGKGPNEISEHRVKGISYINDSLLVLGQVYTGSYNGVRYSGYWYNGTSNLEDYNPSFSPISELILLDLQAGNVNDAKSQRQIIDISSLLIWQDADQKHDGQAPDADMIYWKLEK